ncbi:NIPSNAP family protein [Cochlodiniinecator piscidefendens]|uniref:NIPSNAP family protein n=1 Tax=Cochlodiniinecator piscidefendens TaxID=2715756 RepID=UPI001407B160|nr:NIPSNAP family protein [Cochlodiniinecator piscidefendens]
MITCTLRYEIDPDQTDAFEAYGRVWITLVNRLGGMHHGYWLPHEGANDIAHAMFTFPSLAAYETYREAAAEDADCQRAFAFAKNTGCIRRYDRSFTRPVIDGAEIDILEGFE